MLNVADIIATLVIGWASLEDGEDMKEGLHGGSDITIVGELIDIIDITIGQEANIILVLEI